MTNETKKIVVIGGGTGIFPVTTALKHLDDVSLSTIVAVSDSGGSTGRIRDEFGFPPVGDLRQSLAALAESEHQEWIRKLLLYRFEKGPGLSGHNLGNLILTALQDMTGSTDEALDIAQKIFRLEGHVIPATTDNVNLKVVFKDQSSIVGEHHLDDSTIDGRTIDHVELVPPASLNPRAAAAITEADLIIIGPGDYYASLLAALNPEGTKAAFAHSSAKVLYIMNLMTRTTQTRDMSARDHARGIEAAIGRPLDILLLNNQEIPPDALAHYQAEHEFPVVDDLTNDSRVIRAPLLNPHLQQTSSVDTAHRSLLRHNTEQLQIVLTKIIHDNT